MNPPDAPELGAFVRGPVAHVLDILIKRHLLGPLQACEPQLDPETRAAVRRTVKAIRDAAEMQRSFEGSLSLDAAVYGRTELPFEATPTESWVTPKEAAVRLKLTDHRIRQMTRSGEIPARKRGGRWFVDAAAVDLRAAG